MMGQPEKAFFYVQQTLKYNWSRSVLLNFLDTDLFERQGKAITNFEITLPDAHGDLAQQLLKDPYCFDFVQLTERYNEKELKDELVKNVEHFLLEMGNGFAYMGREYRMLVGETELFCDMLFYNTFMHCYVVVEVKTEKFDNAFLGQLSGYVSMPTICCAKKATIRPLACSFAKARTMCWPDMRLKVTASRWAFQNTSFQNSTLPSSKAHCQALKKLNGN